MKTDDDSGSNSKSVQQYASEVFGEALVTGVPNIVKTPSRGRKLLKLCILLLCIGGFFYQSIEFLTYVFSYPSIVDISVYTPRQYLLPGITVCNNNGIMRSKFCKKYPERCETPANRTEFCDENPNYSQFCSNDKLWENFTVPKNEFYDYETTASIKDLRELSHDKEAVLGFWFMFSRGFLYGIEGPIVFFKNGQRYFSCYTIHYRANTSTNALEVPRNPMGSIKSLMELKVDLEPSETFLPLRKPAGFLTVHSPFEFVHPIENGHSIKPGKFYKVHVNMEEEELLPYPYKTDCMNYSQLWLDSGKKGPRSKGMCKLKCLYDTLIKYCKCTFKTFPYPYDDDACFTRSDDCVNDTTNTECFDCFDSCKDDCQKKKFSYVIQESEIEESELPPGYSGEVAFLSIYLSDAEVVVYKYRPQYYPIEIFSYIGGYVGVWLGISLVAVADFVECFLLTAAFAVTSRKQLRKGKIPDLESKSV